MANDIKFTPKAVVVEGMLGVNEPSPSRPLHVTGDEIHSGGAGAGFSFSDRESVFKDIPENGERWVWYAQQGTAHLWSGGNKLSVSADGQVSAFVTSNIRPLFIDGSRFLGRPAAVRLRARDLILSYQKLNPQTKKWEVDYPDDKDPPNNFALSHWEGDTLVINRDGNYTGGVRIDGDVRFTGKLEAGGKDIATELAELRAELEALKKKVG